MKYMVVACIMLLNCTRVTGQLQWQPVDTGYGGLPAGFRLFVTKDSLDGQPFIAYYAIADLDNKGLSFTTDTTLRRRFTPAQYYEKTKALLIVNGTFFSFATHQNLNSVILNGRQVGYNVHSTAGKGKDTLRYHHVLGSAIGISKKRKADVAWLYTDSSRRYAMAFEENPMRVLDSSLQTTTQTWLSADQEKALKRTGTLLKKWKMQTAIGGGPVLLHNGKIRITNNEEMKFGGKAIHDKHPRTAMGYTQDGKLIILVIQGRFPGIAEGASLEQEAKILSDLGCYEALNLDGGGSSCMLVNGKETIRPSDKTGQRPVPGVFIIRQNR